MANDKKWGILIHLGMNMWGDLRAQKRLSFDKEVWNHVVERCETCGINMIILDLGEGIRYNSHPEIGIEGSLSPEEMTAEVRRLREKGIQLIPKLNFATTHDAWLGIYERMVSTPTYYQVCRDLINEVYEIFDQPEYIHIGMDEESPHHADDPGYSYVVLRRDELLFHDANYLIGCVKETGAKCIMWGGIFIHHPDTAYEKIAEDIVVADGIYYAYNKENWHKISEQSAEVREFYATRFVRRHGYTIEYIEEDPIVPAIIHTVNTCIEKKRQFMAIASNIFSKINTDEVVEYFEKACTDKRFFEGFLTCPWVSCIKANEKSLLESVDLLADARKKYWDK